MTTEEAVKRLKSSIAITECINNFYANCVDLEALKVAVEALEKQMSYDVVEDEEYTLRCPMCGNSLRNTAKYCDNCGQRLNRE